MSRFTPLLSFGCLFALLAAPSARAQYLSELVGFNGPPIDDPATAQEMFQIPQYSGTTSAFVVPNDEPFDQNAAFRASGLQTEGVAAMQVYYTWVDPGDPDAWVRLTTFNAPERPNPALHTAGKVRFKITNRSEFIFGDVGLCLGIRETGTMVGQLQDGGFTGPIEWVGVDTTPNAVTAGPDMIVDTAADGDDVQVYPVGYDLTSDPNSVPPPGTAVITPGPNGVIDSTPAADDQLRHGYFIGANGNRVPIPAITLPPSPEPHALEWDLATGVVRIDGVPQGGGIAGFTGNGLLDVVPTRGTLEHLAFTNVASDTAGFIEVAIDELQFEAPEPDPPSAPTVVGPLLPGLDLVTVTDVLPDADEVTVYIGGSVAGSAAPGGADTVDVTTATLQPGDVVTATQTVAGVISAESEPVVVLASTVVAEYEFAFTLDDLTRAIATDDLLNGHLGVHETGDIDPINGIESWNMVSTSGCLEMAYTQPSPGFHPATPGGTTGGLIDLTDGLEGSTVEAVLADYYRAALVVRYDFAEPVNVGEIVVFAANEDPGAPNNGRLFQHYDVWVSTDDALSFEPLALSVRTADFGYYNEDDFRATFTRVYDGLSGVLAANVTNLRFVFYDVSNTAGRFQDQWQGNHNEDPAYQDLCPDTEPEDTDGYRKAFEAPIIKEIDVFAAQVPDIPGDVDGDGDVDLSDLAALLASYNQCTGDPDFNPDADFDGSGCVDLSDLAELLAHYGEGT